MRKVALVTGGSKGIGAGIALELARNDYDIVINYQSSEERALEISKKCEALGVKALIYQADVSNYDDVKSMITFIKETFGRIDVLVNNSGITKDNLILRMSNDDFRDVIDVNLQGTFNTCKEVAPIMLRQKQGCIINVSSVIGLIGNVGQVNYAASKAGIIGLSKSLAKELASRNIRVNVIAPGFIRTEMTDKLDENTRLDILKMIPVKQFGTIEDVGNLVAFLVSDKAQYITGQVINVDGGMVI